MKDWNPDLYRQFEAERTRPAAELLARVMHPDAKFITDLGCGPGNSTELLQHTYPDALLTGLDTSQAMLEKARERLPSCPSLPLIGSNSGGGGGGAGGATAASSAVSDLDSENLSLAPVLVSIGRKASAHIPGEGMPEMVKAGLGEAGHSF